MRISKLPGHGVLYGAVLMAASCGRSSPVSPDIAAPVSRINELRSGVPVSAAVAFPLVAGSLSIETEKGDWLAGSYSGTVSYPDGTTQSATLTVQISNGSGAFSGAVGTLALRGTGAFVDEGGFLLDGRGEVTLGGRRTLLILSLRGTATAVCSASDRIAILQTATGSMTRAGRVRARLTHEVENTGCSS